MIVNNIAALEILLECGVLRAGILAAVGAVCRAAVGWVSLIVFDASFSIIDERKQGILRAVGVGGGVAAAGVVETSDLLDLWKRVAGNVGLG